MQQIDLPLDIANIANETSEMQERLAWLGWQCGSTYARLYPESSLEQQQQASHADAKQLVAEEDRLHFLEAWMRGVHAALAMRQGEQIGMCPCCGQEDARLTSSYVLFVGEFDDSGQVELVPHHLCFHCAVLPRNEQYFSSLKRPAPSIAPPYKVLSLFVNSNHPTYEVAEAVASSFPQDKLIMRATEGLIAILVEQLTPAQFLWIFSQYALGFIDAMGMAPLYLARSKQCACGHVLRSEIERQRGWCLECGLDASSRLEG